MVSRPGRLVAVVGTATDVGKTWVTANLVRQLRANGVEVAVRKPVQSYRADEFGETDAEVLALAAGDDPHQVCPPHRWYASAMAPPMAAELLGEPPPLLAQLVDEMRWPDPPPSVGFVETVGGIRSPIADDGDSRDLVRAIRPDLILVVAEADLGVIDAVRLVVDAVAPATTIVHLNKFDVGVDIHRRNLAWLRTRDGMQVDTTIDSLTARIVRP